MEPIKTQGLQNKSQARSESVLFSDLLHAVAQVVSNREFKHCVVSMGKSLHSRNTSLHPGQGCSKPD